ncbi:MAG: hypothetical protein AVDCRST_MAG10-595, partial [uncultured Acidimicrobiales bacterium]
PTRSRPCNGTSPSSRPAHSCRRSSRSVASSSTSTAASWFPSG